jgi:hypothetical protein
MVPEKHLPSFELLVQSSDEQRVAILKSLTGPQLRALLEAIYNVLKGTCPIPVKDKKKLFQHRHIIRRLVSKELNRQQQHRLLKKHRQLIPLFLKPVIVFLKRNGD